MLEKLVLYLKNHSWIVGVIAILIGVCIAIRGLMEFLPAVGFLQFGVSNIPIILLVLILGIAYMAVGILLIAAGIKIIKKSKKEQ